LIKEIMQIEGSTYKRMMKRVLTKIILTIYLKHIIK